MTTDPVCGMQVDPAKAAGTFAYQGKTYYFCSQHCLGEFKANPGRYTEPGAPGGGQQRLVFAGEQAAHHGAPLQAAVRKPGGNLAKDPICGMMVDKATALKTERGGRACYFCSAGCQRTFESPEQEPPLLRLSGCRCPARGTTSVTLGSPRVSVPVFVNSALLRGMKLSTQETRK